MKEKAEIFVDDRGEFFIKKLENLLISEDGRKWLVKKKDSKGDIKGKIIAVIPKEKNRKMSYLLNKIELDTEYTEYYRYMLSTHYAAELN